MSKHTPEPWHACERGDYSDYDGDSVVVISTVAHKRVAVVKAEGREQ